MPRRFVWSMILAEVSYATACCGVYFSCAQPHRTQPPGTGQRHQHRSAIFPLRTRHKAPIAAAYYRPVGRARAFPRAT